MSTSPQSVRHLYAHIPFCPTKCPYCAFVTRVGSTKLVEPYMAALQREVSSRAPDMAGPVDTVYLGGGTPSMLSPVQVRCFLDAVRRELGIGVDAELTMEAHPDTVCPLSLDGYQRAGINRLSLGAESLDDSVLRRVGRTHTAARVAEVAREARAAGLDNLSLDLMYGLPGQDVAGWRNTLGALLALQPAHVSLYPLSIEPGTVFARRGPHLALPPDETVVEMYFHACEVLREAGFEHYEVANWAKPGRRSRHNLAYWKSVPFLAVGVGAHGYLAGERYVNMRDVKKYIEAINSGREVVARVEIIDPATELDDFLMLGLRLLQDGVSLEEVGRRFGDEIAVRVLDVASRLTAELHVNQGRVILREEAVPTANAVWSEFIGLQPHRSAATPDLVPA